MRRCSCRTSRTTLRGVEPKENIPIDQPTELSLPDALGIAIQMHRNGELKDAETLYRRILDVAPDYADAIHFYGVMLHHRDRSDEALAMINRSIALDPSPGRYNNLGNVLVERGRLDEAIDAYQRSIDLDATNPDVYNNLGSLQKAQGRIEASEAAYLKSLELAPDHVNALTNLGNLRSDQGRHTEAVALYWKAIGLNPANHRSRHRLGYAYYAVKQFDAAAEAFRLWLQAEPGNPVAEHMVAALSGNNVPVRASNAYIEQTFDGFAASFDAKLEMLSYRAPQLIADAVGRAAGPPAADRVILDAGCGTGLCGPLLAPFAKHLSGVDLSARMLDAARLRGVYHELFKDELTSFIARTRDSVDIITSADTLCYFGALDEVFSIAARALSDDGFLIFSVEAASPEEAPEGFRINPHGRYSHSRRYLENTLRNAGLAVVSISEDVLRSENHLPVNGFVIAAQKGDADG
jgi:predicted TPR repeat methyltransferase